jgi:hypothetical protein
MALVYFSSIAVLSLASLIFLSISLSGFEVFAAYVRFVYVLFFCQALTFILLVNSFGIMLYRFIINGTDNNLRLISSHILR